ncbi:ABC transporter G family member 35 [Cardamine amara subsp. amara]|uniref:ABC transporter G family member 35 n=1 Tax=Cardamine amara subsp. amara TaxID=228776 RepID=A0ABD1A9R4_CARAN
MTNELHLRVEQVTSKKDQHQYWVNPNRPYRYIPVSEFATKFKTFHVGNKLSNELSVPFDKSKDHKAALVFDKYSIAKKKLLKSCWDKKWMLMKRNSFFYVFKTVKIIIIAAITSTLFLRIEMNTRNEIDANVYVGAFLFTMIINMFNSLAEMAMTIQRLPVFYKQRDILFHPPWTYTLPTFLLGIPISIFESTAWMVVTYYSIGFAPDIGRFFKQFLIVFLIQQMAAGIFRFIASICRTMTIANTGGVLVLLVVFLTGGFLLPRSEIPVWWRWAYWISPLSYAFNAITANELFAPRWMNKISSDNTTRLGTRVLNMWDVFDDKNWYWI